MPKRRTISDRLGQDQARGRDAIYGQPQPAPEPPGTVDRQRSTPTASWDDTHQRLTFYCPLDLLEAIEADMRRSGRSKTGVIVDALREHLTRP